MTNLSLKKFPEFSAPHRLDSANESSGRKDYIENVERCRTLKNQGTAAWFRPLSI
jgi:hypothetical protein